MGDIRYARYYRQVMESDDPIREIRGLSDEGVISALAGATREGDPYIANVLATEAMNRVTRKGTIVETAGEGLIALDVEGRITSMNPASERLLGWTEEEILGRDAHEVMHYQDAEGRHVPASECPILGIMRERRQVRVIDDVFSRSDGSLLPVDYTSSPIIREDEVLGAVLVFTDITDRKRAEAALEARARRQAAVAELGQQALESRDLQAVMERAAGRLAELLQADFTNVLEFTPDRSELVIRAGTGWPPGVVGHTTVSATESQAGYTLATGAPVVSDDIARETRFPIAPVVREHGIASTVSVVIPGRDGPFGVLSAHTLERRRFTREDVSFVQAVANILGTAISRRTAELEREGLVRQLQEERARLAAVIRQMPSGVVIAEAPSGRLVLGNEQVERIFQHPFVAAMDISEYAGYRGFRPDGTPLPAEEWALARAVRHGETVRDEEVRIQRGDGTYGWIRLTAAPIYTREGEQVAAVAVFNDITERREAEDLMRFQKSLLEAQNEAVLDGLLVVSPEARILSYNRRLVEMWGFPEELLESGDDESLLRFAAGLVEDPAGFVGRIRHHNSNRTPMSHDEVRLMDGRVLDRFGAPVMSPDGTYYGRLWAFRDVTERRNWERRLAESEQRYRSLFDRNPDAVFSFDAEGRFLSANEALSRLSGYSLDELLRVSFAPLVAPEDLQETQERFRRALGGTAQTYEATLLRKDGERRAVSVTNIPIQVNGSIVGVFGVAKDVTPERRAATEVAAANERITGILESIGDAFLSIDESWRFIYLNAKAERLLQRPREDLLGRLVWEEFPEAVGSQFQQQYERVMREGVPVRFEEWYEPLGRWFEVRAYPNPTGGLSVYFVDITEQRGLRMALEESKERYRVLYENTPAMYFRVSEDGVILSANRAGAETLGYRAEELVGMPVSMVYHPEDQEKLADRLRQVAAGEEETACSEFRKLARDGRVVWVEEGTRMVQEPSGQRVFLITCNDVTDRKRAERLVAGQSRVLELIAQDAPQQEVLDTLVRVIEQDSDGFLGSILLLDSEGERLRHGAAPSIPDEYNRAVDGTPFGEGAGSCGTAAYRGEPVEVTDIATDPLWVNYRDVALRHGLAACWSTPILSPAGAVLGTFALYYREPRKPTEHDRRLIGIATHLAGLALERERRKESVQMTNQMLEARVRERTRDLVSANRELEAFTYLVTHDLKEPVRAVEAYLRALEEDHGDELPGDARELVAGSRDATRRLSVLLNGLLELCRVSASDAHGGHPLRLRDALESTDCTSRYTRLTQERGGRVEVGPGADEVVVAPPSAVCQILGNFIVNALEHSGVPEPVVRVRASRLPASPETAREEVEVVVEDNGQGFPQEILDSFNDPTTPPGLPSLHSREAGGFGLLIARRRVERLGGRLWLGRSELGGGAVHFTLPAAGAETPGAP